MSESDLDSSVFGNERSDTQPSVDGLIAKLEAASEGSRELDALIWIETFPRGHKAPINDRFIPDLIRKCHWEFEAHHDGTVKMFAADKKGRIGFEKASRSAPSFTTSLDAALMLVPPGWQWRVSMTPTDGGDLPEAQVNWEPNGQQQAATPALALCIAALRARQTVPQTVAGNSAQTSNTEPSPNQAVPS